MHYSAWHVVNAQEILSTLITLLLLSCFAHCLGELTQRGKGRLCLVQMRH